MRISLMKNIEDKFIPQRVKSHMQGNHRIKLVACHGSFSGRPNFSLPHVQLAHTSVICRGFDFIYFGNYNFSSLALKDISLGVSISSNFMT